MQVDAAVLKLTPLATPTINVNYKTLETVVKALFQYRRKYIRSGAKYVTFTEKVYPCVLHQYPCIGCCFLRSKIN